MREREGEKKMEISTPLRAGSVSYRQRISAATSKESINEENDTLGDTPHPRTGIVMRRSTLSVQGVRPTLMRGKSIARPPPQRRTSVLGRAIDSLMDRTEHIESVHAFSSTNTLSDFGQLLPGIGDGIDRKFEIVEALMRYQTVVRAQNIDMKESENDDDDVIPLRDVECYNYDLRILVELGNWTTHRVSELETECVRLHELDGYNAKLVADLEQNLLTMKDELKHSEQVCEIYEQQGKDAEKRTAQVYEEISELGRKNARLHKENQILKAEEKSMSARMSDKSDEILDLRDQMGMLKDRLTHSQSSAVSRTSGPQVSDEDCSPLSSITVSNSSLQRVFGTHATVEKKAIDAVEAEKDMLMKAVTFLQGELAKVNEMNEELVNEVTEYKDVATEAREELERLLVEQANTLPITDLGSSMNGSLSKDSLAYPLMSPNGKVIGEEFFDNKCRLDGPTQVKLMFDEDSDALPIERTMIEKLELSMEVDTISPEQPNTITFVGEESKGLHQVAVGELRVVSSDTATDISNATDVSSQTQPKMEIQSHTELHVDVSNASQTSPEIRARSMNAKNVKDFYMNENDDHLYGDKILPIADKNVSARVGTKVESSSKDSNENCEDIKIRMQRRQNVNGITCSADLAHSTKHDTPPCDNHMSVSVNGVNAVRVEEVNGCAREGDIIQKQYADTMLDSSLRTMDEQSKVVGQSNVTLSNWSLKDRVVQPTRSTTHTDNMEDAVQEDTMHMSLHAGESTATDERIIKSNSSTHPQPWPLPPHCEDQLTHTNENINMITEKSNDDYNIKSTSTNTVANIREDGCPRRKDSDCVSDSQDIKINVEKEEGKNSKPPPWERNRPNSIMSMSMIGLMGPTLDDVVRQQMRENGRMESEIVYDSHVEDSLSARSSIPQSITEMAVAELENWMMVVMKGDWFLKPGAFGRKHKRFLIANPFNRTITWAKSRGDVTDRNKKCTARMAEVKQVRMIDVCGTDYVLKIETNRQPLILITQKKETALTWAQALLAMTKGDYRPHLTSAMTYGIQNDIN
eukprot:CFRG8534T1